jgi:hypothetical protein
MGDRLKAGQAEKAARAFDGMHQTENVGKNLRSGILFEFDQLYVEDGEALARLGEEFGQQIVHILPLVPSKRNDAPAASTMT